MTDSEATGLPCCPKGSVERHGAARGRSSSPSRLGHGVTERASTHFDAEYITPLRGTYPFLPIDEAGRRAARLAIAGKRNDQREILAGWLPGVDRSKADLERAKYV